MEAILQRYNCPRCMKDALTNDDNITAMSNFSRVNLGLEPPPQKNKDGESFYMFGY